LNITPRLGRYARMQRECPIPDRFRWPQGVLDQYPDARIRIPEIRIIDADRVVGRGHGQEDRTFGRGAVTWLRPLSLNGLLCELMYVGLCNLISAGWPPPPFRKGARACRSAPRPTSAVRSFPMISSAVWRFLPIRPAPCSIRIYMPDRYEGVRSGSPLNSRHFRFGFPIATHALNLGRMVGQKGRGNRALPSRVVSRYAVLCCKRGYLPTGIQISFRRKNQGLKGGS
jgi:hypothetical protein